VGCRAFALPWLLAFDEADAAIYFGRDDDIRRLIERLNAGARRAAKGWFWFWALPVGEILTAARRGRASTQTRSAQLDRLAPFRPQLHPLDELSQVVAAGLGQATEWRRWRDSSCAGRSRSFAIRIWHGTFAQHTIKSKHKSCWQSTRRGTFRRFRSEQTSQFFHVLSALLDGQLPFLVVMSLRSDFLGWLQQDPRLKAPFEQFSLSRCLWSGVRAIIEGPAKVAGIAVDDGLGDSGHRGRAHVKMHYRF